MKSSGRLARGMVWGRNTVIACLLGLILIDALPIIPPQVRGVFASIVGRMGIWQNHWQLFAPEPMSKNYRFSARLKFADGSATEWHAPDWREQSRWQRFLNYRLSMYMDQVREPQYEPARPALAEYVRREQMLKEPRASRLRHLEVWINDGLINDPNFEKWLPISERMRLENNWQLHYQEYP